MFLLVEVSLCVDIVGKPSLFIADYVVCLLDLQEQVSCVLVWVLVRVVLDAGLAERLFQLLLGYTTGWDFQELVIVLWFFYCGKAKSQLEMKFQW